MELSWLILTFVSQGMIVFYWLTTLAIPFSSLFLCSSCWGHDHEYDWPWFKRFLYNVIPAISSTSIFLIISATSLLAMCNRLFNQQAFFKINHILNQEHCVTCVDDQARLTLCWILLDVLSSLSSFEPLVRSGMDMDTFPNCPKILVPPHAPAHSDWGNLDTDTNNEGKGPA